MKVGLLCGQYARLLCALPQLFLAPAPVAEVAPAAGHRCTGPVFEADQAIVAKNPGLLAKLRARLAQSEVDRCASVRLLAAGDGVMVVVSLSDGRSTVRPVSSGVDVVDVVETLLTLPTPAPSASVSGSEPPAPASARPPEGAARPPSAPPSPSPSPSPSPASSPAPPAETRASTTAFELGLALAGRLSGRPTSFDLSGSALAELILDDWLVSSRAHAELPHETPTRAQLKSYGVGLGGGRRLHGRGIDFDGTLGADVLFQQQTAAGLGTHTLIQPRIVAATRWSEAGPAAFRLYVGADLEVWPGEVRRPRPELSAWSWWSASLSFGVKVSPW
jgi:hypothetical protein